MGLSLAPRVTPGGVTRSSAQNNLPCRGNFSPCELKVNFPQGKRTSRMLIITVQKKIVQHKVPESSRCVQRFVIFILINELCHNYRNSNHFRAIRYQELAPGQ